MDQSIDQCSDILQKQKEMHRVGCGLDEIEMSVKCARLIVLGVNSEGADACDVDCLQRSQKRVLQQGLFDAPLWLSAWTAQPSSAAGGPSEEKIPAEPFIGSCQSSRGGGTAHQCKMADTSGGRRPSNAMNQIGIDFELRIRGIERCWFRDGLRDQ